MTRTPLLRAAHLDRSRRRSPTVAALLCAGALFATGCSTAAEGAAPEPATLAFEETATSSDQTAPQQGTDDDVVIGVLMQNTSRTFFQGLETGARERANDLGVQLMVHDAEDDADAQLAGAQELLAAGVDALALSPVDSGEAVAIVELAEAAGVPVVSVANQVGTVDRVGPQFVYPGTLALVTNDDIDMGRKAAAFVAQLVGDDSVNIGIVEGKSGTANVDMRRAGFTDELAALAIDYRIAASAPGDWTAEGGAAVCADIASDPEVNLIFSMSDAMTAGCAEALAAAARTEIGVVSIGGNAAGIALLQAGSMIGTVCQKPGTMGAIAIELLVEALETDMPIVGLRFYETPVVTVDNQAAVCDPQW